MEKVPGHLQLREVMLLVDGTEVAVAHGAGGQYLVIPVNGRSGACWVCAPATDAAIECVRAGRSSPWTVAHHSATGTVDIFRSGLDGTIVESVVLCSQLPLGSNVLAAA
ncbi:MAG TPA: hypothetical protein VFV02_06080 [Acidimicrobiales bacterium]|nr:hypothetical protein [Acidimicrobiales bacterium]